MLPNESTNWWSAIIRKICEDKTEAGGPRRVCNGEP
jgi:hypothetical protein